MNTEITAQEANVTQHLAEKGVLDEALKVKTDNTAVKKAADDTAATRVSDAVTDLGDAAGGKTKALTDATALVAAKEVDRAAKASAESTKAGELKTANVDYQ